MKQRSLLFYILLYVAGVLQAQTPTDEQNTVLWREHLSYSSLQEVIHDGLTVYGATDQGVFIYNDLDGNLLRVTKQNGLNDFDINDIGLHRGRRALAVGYRSGNLDIISADGTVTNFSDIKRAPGIFGGRAINHTLEWGDTLLLACDFGIVVLDLKGGFFRDTWYIGSDGGQLKINQMDIDFAANRIYAATENGVLSASLNDPLRFFTSWRRLDGAHDREADYVAVIDGKVVYNATSLDEADDSIYVVENGLRTTMPNQLGGRLRELERGLHGLEVIYPFNAILYDNDFQALHNVAVNATDLEDYFPRSMSFDFPAERFWVADGNLGLIRNFAFFYNEFITLDGPPSNNMFRMATAGRELYIAPGGMSDSWVQSFLADGFFAYDGEDSWTQLDAEEDLNDARDIIHVTVDPQDPDHLFLSSWGSGLIELQDGQPIRTYTSANTDGAIQNVDALGDSAFLIGASAYDANGDLWMTNSLVDRSLVVRRADGSWENFSLGSLGGTVSSTRDIITTSEGQIWINSRNSGIIVAQEFQTGLQVRGLSTVPGEGNLPSAGVTCFAEDLDGEVWVGTDAGLGVVYTPYNIFENGLTYDAQPILIETSEGIVERLFNGQPLTAIEVDGANKKWIGTSNNGIFYLSEDGTEEIHHFTAENSPLLSNNILDIAIEDRTGIVYIATDRGLISF